MLALAPLGWIGWKQRAPAERKLLGSTAWRALIGLLTWAAAARFSGYLIQSRLYWAIFPRWQPCPGLGLKHWMN
jgi:hypothetical protein